MHNCPACGQEIDKDNRRVALECSYCGHGMCEACSELDKDDVDSKDFYIDLHYCQCCKDEDHDI